MRIIAGEWRGRKITAPKGETTRPTADRTRETLFSMLTSRLGTFEGLSVGDMFAGSGALGLEALSRGAAHCLFVEQEEQALKAIRANIAAFGAREKSDVRAGSVMGMGAARQPLDLIMLDPPYETGAGMVALDKMQRQGWINDATWLALETGLKEDVSVKNFTIDVERKVGKAKITLMRLSEA